MIIAKTLEYTKAWIFSCTFKVYRKLPAGPWNVNTHTACREKLNSTAFSQDKASMVIKWHRRIDIIALHYFLRITPNGSLLTKKVCSKLNGIRAQTDCVKHYTGILQPHSFSAMCSAVFAIGFHTGSNFNGLLI